MQDRDREAEGPPGMLRRRIIGVALPGKVEVGLEDDYHHVELTLRHDGERVVEIAGIFPRNPFDSCSGSLGRLPDLNGLPLSTRPWQLPREFAAKQHCTHMLDLAIFAVAQAARGGTRQYDLEAPDPDPLEPGKQILIARRDGIETLRWTLAGRTVTAPHDFAGLEMAGLAQWAHATQDDENLELILMLRRTALISGGRRMGPLRQTSVGDYIGHKGGACFTYQPGNESLLRKLDSIKDFTDHPERLLADFRRAHLGPDR